MFKQIDINDFKAYPGGTYIHKDAQIHGDVKISPGCIIHERVIIEEGCHLLERCIVRPEVTIKKNCRIHDSVELGYNNQGGSPTIIGEGSEIRRGSTIYAGSKFGKGFQTGVGVHIREECFFDDYCSVGTFSQFEGYTKIGKYSRFHTNVHIGQNSEINNYVWVFPYVVFTNDKYPPLDICPPFTHHKGPVIEDFSIIATSSVLLPGIKIGKESMIGASSVVTKDVPVGELWMGNPAKFIKKMKDIKFDSEFAKIYGTQNPYPWSKSLRKDGYVIKG